MKSPFLQKQGLKALVLCITAIGYLSCSKKSVEPDKKDNNTASNVVVSTFAGSGVAGSTNGTGTSASFGHPTGIAIDAAGNLYVTDQYNNLIRKISATGVVSTFAGKPSATGLLESIDGTGTSASFNLPFGITIDAAGNLYVSDQGSDLVRKINAAGTVTTFARSGTTDVSTAFNALGVAADAAGNIYLAGGLANSIFKISNAGVPVKLAGGDPFSPGSANGTGSSASFLEPFGVAVDGAGNVYVADTFNNLIRKITAGGVVTTLAGSGKMGFADGTGTAASFDGPLGIAVDKAGNVYVADSDNERIRKITPAGVVTTIAGSGDLRGQPGSSNGPGPVDGAGNIATFNGPIGIAIDAAGNLYVADSGDNLIRKITLH